MNKRKGLLEELRNSGINQSLFKQLTVVMQRYYAVYDLDCGTNLHGIFTALYVNGNLLTYDEVAFQFGVSVPTLGRYVKQFNALAQKLLSKDIFALPHNN